MERPGAPLEVAEPPEGFRPLDLFRGFAEGIGPQTIGMLGAYLEAQGVDMLAANADIRRSLREKGKDAPEDEGIESARKRMELGKKLQEWAEGGGFNLTDEPMRWEDADGVSESASAVLGMVGSAFGQVVPMLAAGAAGKAAGGGFAGGVALGAGGGFAAGYVMNYGDTYSLIKEELGPGNELKAARYAKKWAPVISSIDTLGLGLSVAGAGTLRTVKKAAVKSLLAAKATDAITDQQAMSLARKAFGQAGVTKKMLQEANKGGIRASLAGTGRAAAGGAFAEGGTEALQRLVQGVAATDAGAQVDWGRTFKEAAVEGALGGVVGGTLSGGGRMASNRQAIDQFQQLPEEQQEAHLEQLGGMEAAQSLPRKERRSLLKFFAGIGKRQYQRKLTHGPVGSALGEGVKQGTRITVTTFDEDQNPTEKDWVVSGGAESYENEEGRPWGTALTLTEVLPQGEEREPRVEVHPFPHNLNWKVSENQPSTPEDMEIKTFMQDVENALADNEARDKVLKETLAEVNFESLDAVAKDKETRAKFLKLLKSKAKAAGAEAAARKEEVKKKLTESVAATEKEVGGDKWFEGTRLDRTAKSIQQHYPTEEELLRHDADADALIEEGAQNAKYQLWSQRAHEMLLERGIELPSAVRLGTVAGHAANIEPSRRPDAKQIETAKGTMQKALDEVNKWSEDTGYATEQLGLPRMEEGTEFWANDEKYKLRALSKPFKTDDAGKLTAATLVVEDKNGAENGIPVPTQKKISLTAPTTEGGGTTPKPPGGGTTPKPPKPKPPKPLPDSDRRQRVAQARERLAKVRTDTTPDLESVAIEEVAKLTDMEKYDLDIFKKSLDDVMGQAEHWEAFAGEDPTGALAPMKSMWPHFSKKAIEAFEQLVEDVESGGRAQFEKDVQMAIDLAKDQGLKQEHIDHAVEHANYAQNFTSIERVPPTFRKLWMASFSEDIARTKKRLDNPQGGGSTFESRVKKTQARIAKHEKQEWGPLHNKLFRRAVSQLGNIHQMEFRLIRLPEDVKQRDIFPSRFEEVVEDHLTGGDREFDEYVKGMEASAKGQGLKDASIDQVRRAANEAVGLAGWVSYVRPTLRDKFYRAYRDEVKKTIKSLQDAGILPKDNTNDDPSIKLKPEDIEQLDLPDGIERGETIYILAPGQEPQKFKLIGFNSLTRDSEGDAESVNLVLEDKDRNTVVINSELLFDDTGESRWSRFLPREPRPVEALKAGDQFTIRRSNLETEEYTLVRTEAEVRDRRLDLVSMILIAKDSEGKQRELRYPIQYGELYRTPTWQKYPDVDEGKAAKDGSQMGSEAPDAVDEQLSAIRRKAALEEGLILALGDTNAMSFTGLDFDSWMAALKIVELGVQEGMVTAKEHVDMWRRVFGVNGDRMLRKALKAHIRMAKDRVFRDGDAEIDDAINEPPPPKPGEEGDAAAVEAMNAVGEAETATEKARAEKAAVARIAAAALNRLAAGMSSFRDVATDLLRAVRNASVAVPATGVLAHPGRAAKPEGQRGAGTGYGQAQDQMG